jgi:hypothetical protein
LLLAIVLLTRTGLAPARAIPIVSRRPLSTAGWWAGVGVALPVSWVLGGVPAVAAVLVGVVVRRPRLLRWLALAFMVAAPVIVGLQLLDGPRLRFDAADAVAGFGFVLALMSLAPRWERRPR